MARRLDEIMQEAWRGSNHTKASMAHDIHDLEDYQIEVLRDSYERLVKSGNHTKDTAWRWAVKYAHRTKRAPGFPASFPSPEGFGVEPKSGWRIPLNVFGLVYIGQIGAAAGWVAVTGLVPWAQLIIASLVGLAIWFYPTAPRKDFDATFERLTSQPLPLASYEDSFHPGFIGHAAKAFLDQGYAVEDAMEMAAAGIDPEPGAAPDFPEEERVERYMAHIAQSYRGLSFEANVS
jgi:hypothetical protein